MSDNSIGEVLKALLGDNAEGKLKSVLGMLEDNNINASPENLNNTIIPEDSKSIQNPDLSKVSSIFNERSYQNDPRSNLLLALKPYMSENRKKNIDSAIKLLAISKMSGLFR